MIWTEQGQLLTNWEGPDNQDGLGYIRRFTAGENAVVDVAFYVMPSPTGGYDVWSQTEHILCRDRRDVGSTETWSAAVEACVVRGLRTAAVAHARAELAARCYSGTTITWDGRTHR